MPTKMILQGRAWLATGAAVGLVLGISGCGSNAGSGTGSGNSQSATVNAQIVQKCDSMLKEARQPLTWKAPGPGIATGTLKGKRIVFVSLDQSVPAIAQAASATSEAAKLVGLDVSVYDTKGNVTRMQQGIQQAIDTKASAIILLGIPLEPTAAVLKKAKDAGIAVVSELSNQPDKGKPGQGAGASVFGSTGPSRTVSGELMACKAVVDTKGKANALIFGVDELKEAAPPQVAGMEEILNQCGGCKYDKNSTAVAAWQTELPSKASSVILSDPSVNYLLPLYDGMALFMVPGVQRSGAADRVKIVSFNASPAALSLINQGSPLVADPGQPTTWMAWQGVDQAMRGMLGLEPGDPVVPIRFFDKENLSGVDVKSEDALFGTEYKAGFKALWSVA